MKLEERFKQWLDTKPREQIREVQLQVISDDYAIDFAEWMLESYIENNDKIASTKQLLEIFKKEKGL